LVAKKSFATKNFLRVLRPFAVKIQNIMLSIIFGLSSALIWGAADFCGGLASRKAKAYQAVLLGEAIGLAVLLIVAFLSGEPLISLASLWPCALAGVMGVLGLLLFFQAITKGLMSVAAPVSALMAVVIPVIFGILTSGFPGWLIFIGFLLAMASIWFISQPDGGPKSIRLRITDLSLPLIAGFSFGVYLILMHHGSQSGLFWPMVTSRTAGVATMLVYALITRQRVTPPKSVWPLLVLNGILDVTGNGFYLLAAKAGRMDVAAVLVSLYPGSTVILAGLLLRERLNRLQITGILAALAAIVFLTI
jgi:drug/metabolite transporter (DMT)-like permease